MLALSKLPREMLPFSKKTREWRKLHLDWADRRTYFYDSTVRKSLIKKKINYNLLNGYLDMQDLSIVLNPEQVQADYIPETIQHYPIMNSKLNVLRGEEAKRRFDFRAIVTNPNALSEIEESKKQELFARLQELIANNSMSEDDFNNEIDKLTYYFTYEWQDIREQRANLLLKHYIKELAVPTKFNAGFVDAMAVGEEEYQCDIVGGEPTFERLNPMKVHAFRQGYSSRIEDADIIILIDFWSPGKIIETFYDVLTPKDIEYIDNLPQSYATDEMQNHDERNSFVNFADVTGNEYGEGTVIDNFVFFGNTGVNATTNYFDNNGNIRVLRMYWKSKRKIKEVKSYDPETGEEEYNFYPETYIINKDLGEEEKILWIDEAWEGTKIGKDIYLNMRPRLVQYNRLSNPSRCHFGIVGGVYNLNDSKPFSLVDMMKPYSYLYDVIHDRLNKAIAANWGKILRLDLALVPKGWDVTKWVHFAKVNHIAVQDGFKEGSIGPAKGKLAGMMGNQNTGVIDAETGNYIQQHLNLLEFIKMEMSEVAGISKQREGQISARETVGGVERATLQSSHITEWLFTVHDDIKRRALECLLETAKMAIRGGSKKFQYILNDGAMKIMEIDGDEFADCDYGIMVDSSPETQQLTEKLDTLAQAALQNQTLSFYSIMKIFTSPSLSEIQRIIEKDEKDIQERQAQAQQQQLESQQAIAEQQAQTKLAELQLQDQMNQRDNETKILVAQIAHEDTELETDEAESNLKKEELLEKIRQFNIQMELEREKLKSDTRLKEKELSIKSKQKTSTNTK